MHMQNRARRRNVVDCSQRMHCAWILFRFVSANVWLFFCFWRVVDCMFFAQHSNTHAHTLKKVSLSHTLTSAKLLQKRSKKKILAYTIYTVSKWQWQQQSVVASNKTTSPSNNVMNRESKGKEEKTNGENERAREWQQHTQRQKERDSDLFYITSPIESIN